MSDNDPAFQLILRQLGADLRARRKALGISATAAAAAAGLSRITWYRLEKGEPGVAAGSLVAAASVLGQRLELRPQGARVAEPAATTGSIPLQIRPQDYPQLEQLAWQLDRATVLTPREAHGLYRRNWRHVDSAAMTAEEQALVAGLQSIFGDADV